MGYPYGVSPEVRGLRSAGRPSARPILLALAPVTPEVWPEVLAGGWGSASAKAERGTPGQHFLCGDQRSITGFRRQGSGYPARRPRESFMTCSWMATTLDARMLEKVVALGNTPIDSLPVRRGAEVAQELAGRA